jgi:DNA-binding transcriptional ArsR family regulator
MRDTLMLNSGEKIVDDEIEGVILQALSHKMRRKILRILKNSKTGVSYTELLDNLKLSTGRLNYHLNQLEGLVEKNEEQGYLLTPLGQKALDLLGSINHGLDTDYEKFVKTAHQAQRHSLQPPTKSFIYILMIGDFTVSLMTAWLVYVAFVSGGPNIVFVLLPLLFCMEIAFLAWLIYVLKVVPDHVKRLERKVFESK